MTVIENGGGGLTWRRSYRCESGACVEVAFGADDTVYVRDSKDRNGTVLRFTRAEWATFTAGVQDGEFNL
jgi:hypothetical protein